MRDIHFTGGLLGGRSVLLVEGPDAAHFLHNLVTADIEGMVEGEARYAALLTPQGKILFDFFVARDGDAFIIDCATSQKEALLKRLGLYKLRAKVTITAAPDKAVAVSPAGGGAADPREPRLGWRSIVAAGSEPEAQGYDAARISLGLPDTDADLGSGEFFPHEANLDQFGAVSFTKGCYVGQEVVSRMEHRGLARNRILPVTLGGNVPPKGTEIRAGDKLIGTLLSSQGNRALAVIRLDRLAEATGPLLTGGVSLAVHKPAFARYEVVEAEEQT